MPMLKKHTFTLLVTALLILIGILATVRHAIQYYPVIDFDLHHFAPASSPDARALSAKDLHLTYVYHAFSTQQSCEEVSGSTARRVLTACPSCALRQLSCVKQLPERFANALTSLPVPEVSSRLRNGTILFSSANPQQAWLACQEDPFNLQSVTREPFRCVPAQQTRPLSHDKTALPATQTLLSLSIGLLAVLVSWLICGLIVKSESMHGHFTRDQVGGGPQKMHQHPTPRIGGLGLIGGLAVCVSFMLFSTEGILQREFGLLILCSMPAFLGGIIEDVTRRVGVLERLLLTMLSASLAAWLLNGILTHVHIPGIDALLMMVPFALIFTIVAVGGVANALNIIDGFNGLSASYALIVSVGLAYVANRVGDPLVFTASLALAGCLLGFLIWNWPRGKLFLGDGGAYLVGFLLAEQAVLLTTRNPDVSPWYPVVLLIYPVFETLFSIYRRKIIRGRSPGHPDGLHLHTLIYRRIVPRCGRSGGRLSPLTRNNCVARYILLPILLLSMLATAVWFSTPALVLLTLGYCLYYTVSYRRIVKWKRRRPGMAPVR